MSDPDTLRRFLFEDFPVRGQIVHVDSAWQAVLERHDYPEAVKTILGQAIAATVLLASTLKFSGRMTLQIEGDGALNLLVVQCADDLKIRGLARWQRPVTSGSFREQVGNGRLVITIATDRRSQPYQGIVPISGDTLNDCLGAYFETSEQLPTRIWLAANSVAAAGLLLQRLPEEHPDVTDRDDWQRVQFLADTVSQSNELLELPQPELLHRLFHEDTVRLYKERPVVFQCSCTLDRIEQMLQTLGKDELRSIIDEQDAVTVVCEFCNKTRRFDAVDVERLLVDPQAPAGPGTLH